MTPNKWRSKAQGLKWELEYERNRANQCEIRYNGYRQAILDLVGEVKR